MSWIETTFKIEERNSTVRIELFAGLTTFLTMSYIIVVQPVVLNKCGMDFGSVMVATCIGSAIATFVMAFLANYPIALAPAMGHNIYLVYTVCLGMGIPWAIALGANFLSGLLFIILSFWSIRENLINAVPDNLRSAISVGIGLLITFVGLEWAGIVVPAPGTFITLGSLKHPATLISILGFLVIATCISLRIRGAILLGILTSTILGIIFGYTKIEGIFSSPPSISATFIKLDILGVFKNFHTLITVVFVLWFLDVFDTVGTLLGVGEQGGFIKDGKLPRARQALLSDAIGTVSGTLLGTSTITSYIESAAGINAGGRTGLANVVTALLFLTSLFLYPLIKTVAFSYQLTEGQILYPAIAPALITVGSFMMINVKKIKWDEPTESIPSFLCIIIMALSFSITEGIAFGFISYSLLKLFTKKYKEVHWIIYLISILLLVRYIFLT